MSLFLSVLMSKSNATKSKVHGLSVAAQQTGTPAHASCGFLHEATYGL